MLNKFLNNQVIEKNYVFLKVNKGIFTDKETKKEIVWANLDVAEITENGGVPVKLRFKEREVEKIDLSVYESLVLGDIIALNLELTTNGQDPRIVDFGQLLLHSNLREEEEIETPFK